MLQSCFKALQKVSRVGLLRSRADVLESLADFECDFDGFEDAGRGLAEPRRRDISQRLPKEKVMKR